MRSNCSAKPQGLKFISKAPLLFFWSCFLQLRVKSYTALFSYPGKGEESYPDLLALVIAVIVTIIVAMGVKNSVGLNNVLNVINLAVWIFIMIAGLFFVKADNWSEGQFLPFGWPGVSPVHAGGGAHGTYVVPLPLPRPQLCSQGTDAASTSLPRSWPCQTHLLFGQRPPASSPAGLEPSLTHQTPEILRCFARISCFLLELTLLFPQIACDCVAQEMPLILRLTTARCGGRSRKGAQEELAQPLRRGRYLRWLFFNNNVLEHLF